MTSRSFIKRRLCRTSKCPLAKSDLQFQYCLFHSKPSIENKFLLIQRVQRREINIEKYLKNGIKSKDIFRCLGNKVWKKLDEKPDDRRPPWQIVGLSKLPKADKNALLRAKLLDASRRMRMGKIPVAVQTDSIQTKLMKEVNTDIQTDLIEMVDAEILTDGAITMSEEGPGDFMLTHSVAQMTDVVMATEAQTQTDIPRSTNKFFEEYFSERVTMPDDDEELKDNLTKNEIKLLNQVKEIRQIDELLNGRKEHEGNDSELSDDSLLNDDDGFKSHHFKKFLRRKSYKRPKNFLKPTLSSWRFDLSDDDEMKQVNFQRRRCFTESNRPWSSFNDAHLDNKLANMKLVPIPAKKFSTKRRSITWSDIQHNAVVDLINEANALLNVFEEIAILLGPDIKLSELPEKDNTEINFLSNYWEPILRQSAHALQYKINTLQNLPMKKVDPITPEMLEEII